MNWALPWWGHYAYSTLKDLRDVTKLNRVYGLNCVYGLSVKFSAQLDARGRIVEDIIYMS